MKQKFGLGLRKNNIFYKNMAKALILFSGGLDSVLAVKLLEKQGIEVQGVCFESCFFGCEKAKISAEEIGLKLEIININKKLLEIVKNPPSGYGKNLNPCIDCHSLMAQLAGEFARENNFEVIATGEVLGQRPFSQNKDSLKRVEKIAGVEILRPLSAKLLPETEYEKNGLVNRGRLLDISGRSRERQLELAEKYNLKNYSTPAGGCLLTDPEFSQRLMKMLDYFPDCNSNDVELLKYGRVFWLNLEKNKKVLIVIGRHEKDNSGLEKLAKKGDVVIELKEIAGPLTILRFKNLDLRFKNEILEMKIPEILKKSEIKLGEEKSEEEILNIAGLLTGYYAVKARDREVNLKIKIIK